MSPPPPRPPARGTLKEAPVFTTGMMVKAKYSGDGEFYAARIEDIQDNQYLVAYVDFANDQEWLPSSSLKLES